MTRPPGYAAEEAEYRVLDESVHETEPQILKSGDQFGVFDRWGDILPADPSAKGLFRRDTRHLSRWELRLFGARPLLLSTGNQSPTTLTTDLGNPDYDRQGKERVSHNTFHIERIKFMSGLACFERIRVQSYSLKSHRILISLCFEADFKDIFEVRGHAPQAQGRFKTAYGRDRIVFDYRARDGVANRTTVRFDPPPSRLAEGTARYDLSLSPKESAEIVVEVCCEGEPRLDSGERFESLLAAQQQSDRLRRDAAAAIRCSDPLFETVLDQARSDLYLLTTDTPYGPYPYAGVPWFSTIFGRDGILTALLAGWIDPEIARGAIRVLAATQAQETDPDSDAQPGKIVHEIRHGEMSRLGEVPFARYYGTVDATPLFVSLVASYVRQTGDMATLREVWPNLERANAWIDDYGDSDGDGFVEYQAQTPTGLANQGWKDSYDSVSHLDGTLAEGPIALCEVQAYTHMAKQDLAALAGLMGHSRLAASLERQAEDLRRRFDESFWVEELSTYALALDGRKRPCKVRSSNAGHVLFGGLALEERAARLEATLLAEESFCGWGLRTLASDAVRFNPMAYHNGSVWPHDNAIVALGLARYGLNAGAVRILSALYDAAQYMDLYRLPELFCGFARDGNAPTRYPVACSPQAWASAALFGLLKAALGIGFDAQNRTLLLDRPSLPTFIDQMSFSGLRIGGESLDLELHRHDGAVAVHVRRRSGDIDVVVIH